MKKAALAMLTLIVIVGCGEQTPTAKRSPEMAIPFSQDKQRTDQEPTRFVVVEPGEVTRTEYEATIIDTRTFAKQVWRDQPYDGEIRDSELRGNESEDSELRKGKQPGPANNLQVDGRVASFDRIDAGPSFPGISQSLFDPPDPTLAVGPNHSVQMVNSEIAFFGKDGQVQFQAILGSQGNPGFFECVGSEDFCVDPRCFYDHYTNRFVVLCLEVYFSPPDSFLTLAVSDDDDPNGIWFKYRTDGVYQSGGQNNFADYPTFGYDEQGYYIGGNLFSITDFSSNGRSMRTIDKTPLLNGDPIVVNDIVDLDGARTLQMAKSFGSPSQPIGVSLSSFPDTANLIAVENPFSNPSLTSFNVPIPPFQTGGVASNAGGGNISTLSGRAMNAHVRDGKLYTCHTVAAGSRDLVRWYEFDLNDWPGGADPTLIQSGEIDLGPGQATFYPAIFSNNNSGLAVVYGNSSPTEFVSVKVSGRNANDPPGTMSAPVQLGISSVTANGRYGDYFDIAIDPNDDTTFWVVGQTAESFGWDTIINSFVLPETTTETNAVSIDVFRGMQISGTVVDAAASDDSYFVTQPGFTLNSNEAPVWLITDAVLPNDTPSILNFSLEANVDTPNLTQTIEMFNWNLGVFEEVDLQAASFNTDLIVEIDLPVSEFVEAGTGAVRARAGWRANGFVLLFPWSVSVDRAFWESD